MGLLLIGIAILVSAILWRVYLDRRKVLRTNKYGVEEFRSYGSIFWDNLSWTVSGLLLVLGIFVVIIGGVVLMAGDGSAMGVMTETNNKII